MNPFSRTIDRTFAGMAHRDIYPSRKACAAAHGHTASTESSWAKVGPPALVKYAKNAPDPWRLAAHMRTLAEQREMEDWPLARLEERWGEVSLERLLVEQKLERIERGMDRATQLETAELEEKLSALYSRRAALRVLRDKAKARTRRPGQ